MGRSKWVIALALLAMVCVAGSASAAVISIDVVTNGSVAVSNNVNGSPFTGQDGLWNELPLDGGTITLSGLKDGTQTPTGVGFVFDTEGVGYHVQVADSPYDPGVVLDNPEQSWVTGGESPVTFKFTGLTAGAQYNLAIYNSADPLMTLTISGTDYTSVDSIFSTSTIADANGEIIGSVSCGGDWGARYAEIAGFQLEAVPEPATMSLLVLGGLAMLRRRRNA